MGLFENLNDFKNWYKSQTCKVNNYSLCKIFSLHWCVSSSDAAMTIVPLSTLKMVHSASIERKKRDDFSWKEWDKTALSWMSSFVQFHTRDKQRQVQSRGNINQGGRW